MSDQTVVPDLYADQSDYSDWIGGTTVPATITATLRACTGLVADATEGDVYDVFPTSGLPTDTGIRNALRDATCAQAAAWVALGIDPLLGGVQTALKGTATTRKIGSATITRSDQEAAAVAAAAAAARTGLVPAAATILRRAGLGSMQVWT